MRRRLCLAIGLLIGCTDAESSSVDGSNGPSAALDASVGIGDAINPDAAPLPNRAGTPFACSQPTLCARTNEFWRIFAAGECTAPISCYAGGGGSGNYAWLEWAALKQAWTNHGGFRSGAMSWLRTQAAVNGINGVRGQQPAGYVWSWPGRETWPDDNARHQGVGSYHFDQLPRFIIAVHDYFVWTRDTSFLDTMLPRVELVMDSYLLGVMRGGTGALAIPGSANNGLPTSRPSNYMDQIRFGYQDGWVNAAFYTALADLATLEDAAGKPAARDRYRTLAAAFPARFDAALWNAATGRYAGWRDAAGALHDAGYTWVNLEALARGLGNLDHADLVFAWLSRPAQPTVAGAHVGSTNPYQNVFGPRSTTSSVPQSDWDGWSDAASGRSGYGFSVENGGSLLWEAYYDVMARLRYADADDALEHFYTMLARMEADSRRLTFHNPDHRYDDFGEGFGEVGTSLPFPESGISAMSFLHGFMGVRATAAGLVITPELPFDVLDARASEVSFAGRDRTVLVGRGRVVSEQDGAAGVARLTPGASLTQVLASGASFNELSVFVGTYLTTNSAFTLSLERARGTQWTRVASRRLTAVRDNFWVSIAFGDQPAGESYRITLSDVSGSIAWYRNDQSFLYRAITADHSTVLDQRQGDVADALDRTLGQTFQADAPFDRVAMRIGSASGAASCGFTATLYHDVGGRWAKRQEQRLLSCDDSVWTTMAFAQQAAGKYLLEMTAPSGSVIWYRTVTDVYAGGGLYALSNGVPQPGDRAFQVLRGSYRIAIPADGIDVTIPAGESYLLRP